MNDIVSEVFRKIRDSVNCQLPCKITAVNSDGTVDVLVFRNDNIPDCVFPNVPVKHIETSRAYVFLGLSVGDRGVIRFFDRSVEEYKKGNENETDDTRLHSFSDGLFEIGFLPSSEKFVFPDGEIVIGLKNNLYKINIDNLGNVDEKSQSKEMTIGTKMELTCPIVNINGSLNVSTGASGLVYTGTQVLTFTNGILTNIS